MYAPFRLPPLDGKRDLSFDPHVTLLREDIQELSPAWIVTRLQGVREPWEFGDFLKSYTFEFKGQFAAGDTLTDLKMYQDTLEDVPLTILPKTYLFEVPTIVEGNQSKKEGSPHLAPLFPEAAFEFLTLKYTLQNLDCIERDLFDVFYKR